MGFDQGKTWSRRYREVLQMPARFVCLRLGGGDVGRRRKQVSSRRSKGTKGTVWESGLGRRQKTKDICI